MIADTDTLTFLDSPLVLAVPTDNVDSPAPAPTDSTAQTAPTTSTTPFTPPRIFRFAAPTGSATDVGQPSSGLNVFDTPTSSGSVSAVIAPTGTTTASPATTTATQPTGTTGGLTSGPTSPITGSGDDLINRLMDLVAAQYSGVAVPGGGTGFSGLVSGPIDASGDAAAPAKSSGKSLLILALIVAGLGYWFYKSHKKHHKAA
jgi:hypothetical protein